MQILCFTANVETTINLNAYSPEYTMIDLVCSHISKAEQRNVE